MQNEPTDPQAELREQVEDMAMKYNIPLADLESLIDELLTTERERVIGEVEAHYQEMSSTLSDPDYLEGVMASIEIMKGKS